MSVRFVHADEFVLKGQKNWFQVFWLRSGCLRLRVENRIFFQTLIKVVIYNRMRSTQRKIQVLKFDTTENGTDLEDNYLTTSPTFNEETTIITGNLTLIRV